MMVRNVLVQFISDHKDHFSALVIDPEGTETTESHITKMKKPMLWASQVELQPAADFYAIPIYIYTQTLDKTGYHWLQYTPRMKSAPYINHTHLELAHRHSIHFDCIADDRTKQSHEVPPLLTGMTLLVTINVPDEDK